MIKANCNNCSRHEYIYSENYHYCKPLDEGLINNKVFRQDTECPYYKELSCYDDLFDNPANLLIEDNI